MFSEIMGLRLDAVDQSKGPGACKHTLGPVHPFCISADSLATLRPREGSNMSLESDLEALSAGARFWRADLHIHTFGASVDVKDQLATPEAVVNTAEAERLSLIAITDHNSIENVAAAVEASAPTSVTVLSGVELSTPSGHLLVYFADRDALSSFFYKLDIADQGTPNSRCKTSMLECLNLAQAGGGFCLLAHVDGGKGLERELPGASPHKSDIISHPALMGIELKSSSSDVFYSDKDPDAGRRQLGKSREDALGAKGRQSLARVMFSDAHSLNALGRNASNDRRVTRFKAHRPDFAGFRQALQVPDSRVRIEELVPLSVPRIEGVRISGGFLNGQTVRFSPNLTCIIGGRGAGKSTLLEVARVLTGGSENEKLVRSDVWPAKAEVVWRDAAGGLTRLRRDGISGTRNETNPYGPTQFPVESYGQGQLVVDSSPAALLRFLDQFTDVEELQRLDSETRTALLENQRLLEAAQDEYSRLPAIKKRLSHIETQIKLLAQEKGEVIVEFEANLAAERQKQARFRDAVRNWLQTPKRTVDEELVAELNDILSGEALKQAREKSDAVRAATETFEKGLADIRTTSEKLREAFNTEITAAFIGWDAEIKELQAKVDKKRAELEAKGVKLDSQFIQKVARDAANYRNQLEEMKKTEKLLKELRKSRSDLLSERRTIRGKISASRDGLAVRASQGLRHTLAGLGVSLKFRTGCLAPSAVNYIKEAMGYRTSKVPKAKLLVEQLGVEALLDALKSKDHTQIASVKTADGDFVFTNQQAKVLVETLSLDRWRFLLERCEVEDLPQITVSRVLEEGGVRTRGFERLSLGQQQSILLTLMLSSPQQVPLVIDQPEDNLDAQFIYSSLVTALRDAKERRQIIVVTHNPNIAVLGDAEQILVLKSTRDFGKVVGAGSIDDEKTRNLTCDVLEGAREAFRLRGEIYGEFQ